MSASLDMRLDNSTSLDITPFVKNFVWRESLILGGFYWMLDFSAVSWNEWDDLMMGRERRTVQFRLRVADDQGSQSTEWRTAVVDKSRAAFSQDTSMLGSVTGCDAAALLAQRVRTRTFRQRTAAEVLRIIANEHNLVPDVLDTRGVRDWHQIQEDDWSFARRVARGASTAGGRGDTYLWIDENVMRFGAPSLSALSSRSYNMNNVEGRVDGYSVSYHGREADRMGAATLTGMGFNFALKRAVNFTMNAATAATQPALADRVPRFMIDGLRIVPVFETGGARVEETTRARWGRVAPRYLGLHLRSRSDVTLRPNTMIALEANLDGRRQTPFMGRYVVVETEHTLTKGVIESSFVAYRREAQVGDAVPTGASADVVGTRDKFQLAGVLPTTTVVAQRLS